MDHKTAATVSYNTLMGALRRARATAQGYYAKRELALMAKLVPDGEGCPRAFESWVRTAEGRRVVAAARAAVN